MAKTATIDTSMGTIELELYPDDAPETVANFEKLAGDVVAAREEYERLGAIPALERAGV